MVAKVVCVKVDGSVLRVQARRRVPRQRGSRGMIVRSSSCACRGFIGGGDEARLPSKKAVSRGENTATGGDENFLTQGIDSFGHRRRTGLDDPYHRVAPYLEMVK